MKRLLCRELEIQYIGRSFRPRPRQLCDLKHIRIILSVRTSQRSPLVDVLLYKLCRFLLRNCCCCCFPHRCISKATVSRGIRDVMYHNAFSDGGGANSSCLFVEKGAFTADWEYIRITSNDTVSFQNQSLAVPTMLKPQLFYFQQLPSVLFFRGIAPRWKRFSTDHQF